MATEITDDQLQQFLSEERSQNEIARRTGLTLPISEFSVCSCGFLAHPL
jgi:hypothetical protein